MSREQILDKMTFILNKDELSRLNVEIGEDGNPFIKLDMHGYSIAKAKAILDKTILLNREAFNIELIHGYNKGIAIKKMLLSDYSNKRIIRKRSYNENPGLTFMQIAEF